MLAKLVICLIAFNYPSPTLAAKKRFTVELKGLTCAALTSSVKRFECNFRKLGTGNYAIDMSLRLGRELNKNAWAHTLIQVKMGGKILSFVNLKQKLCDALNQARNLPIIKQMINEVLRTSNLPRSCPIKGNIAYNVTDLSVTDVYFPTYTPLLNFNLSVFLYEYQKAVASYLLQGATVTGL